MAIVTFKLHNEREKFRLRSRAEDLLTAGHDEASAAQIMVTEAMCTAHIAKYIVEWVKVYNWSRFSKK